MTIPLKTVAIAEKDPALCLALQRSLGALNYEIIATAVDGEKAIEAAKTKSPQLILISHPMPILDGLEAARRIIPLQSTAVVLMTEEADPVLIRQALDLGICGYLHKPIDFAQIGPVMETAWHQFQVVGDLHKQMSVLNETIETRKLLEKAKGILMEQQGFTEESAHKTIQKMSQDQGIAVKEVCRSIIQVKMVLGKMAPKRVV